jgi:hypothetical protein
LWKQGRPYFPCDRKLHYIYACSVNMTFRVWITPWWVCTRAEYTICSFVRYRSQSTSFDLQYFYVAWNWLLELVRRPTQLVTHTSEVSKHRLTSASGVLSVAPGFTTGSYLCVTPRAIVHDRATCQRRGKRFHSTCSVVQRRWIELVAWTHIKVSDVHCGHVTEKVQVWTHFARQFILYSLKERIEENVVTVIYRAYWMGKCSRLTEEPQNNNAHVTTHAHAHTRKWSVFAV